MKKSSDEEEGDPLTRDRTYFGQTKEVDGKLVPHGFGRFITYMGDIIEAQLTNGEFDGYVRLITIHNYVHYMNYKNGVKRRSIDINPWGREVANKKFN